MKKVFLLALVFIFIVAVFLLVSSIKTDKKNDFSSHYESEVSKTDSIAETKTYKVVEKETAYYMAQKIIKKGLKSPGSAAFQNYYQGVTVDYSEEKDEYYLKFWGEAKNSYGVDIRNSYYVVIKKDGELWEITDMMKN